MSLAEWIALTLAMAIFGTLIALLVVLRKRALEVIAVAWSWLPPVRRARRLAAEVAYEQWKRKGGAWLDSWWTTPETPHCPVARAPAAPPEIPGRMSIEAARRKLEALLALTVARGATPAEAAAAQAVAERLKADYDLS